LECTDEFDVPGDSWQHAIVEAVRSSSCMVVLMGRQTPDADHKYVAWEIACAMQCNLPVYVMKRRDRHDRWAGDREIRQFLGKVDVAHRRRYGRLRLWPETSIDRLQGFEGWDPNTWAYPQMCQFLDEFAPR
jgi:hypothetical protein